jgi:hypothetical protein
MKQEDAGDVKMYLSNMARAQLVIKRFLPLDKDPVNSNATFQT